MPEAEGAEIRAIASAVTYGWGMIPVRVRVRVGATAWRTSLFPKEGRYLVPLKDAVRRAERIAEGDVVEVRVKAWSGARCRDELDRWRSWPWADRGLRTHGGPLALDHSSSVPAT